ncbi:MAG: MFS transporter [Proteobacteria bacterium]|nr:MFS transporter [Pseudomonadota bacterium]
MLIPLLATLIMAGFVTTVGLLTEPAATHYGVPITSVAAQFTWFTGGVFLGGILAFFVFDYVAIRPVIVWSYLVTIILILWLHFAAPYSFLPVLLLLIGTLMAIVICGGVTVITQQWQGHRRQMIMVAQDAMFNGGGIVFSGAATWFVINEFGWSSVYLVVAALSGLVVLVSAISSFDPAVMPEEVESPDESTLAGNWNPGILLVGFSLLLFMMAKISIFVWAPQFIQQTFDVGPEAGGQFMANVFAAAFVGSLFGTWAASRIEVKYLLYCFVLVSMLAVLALTLASSLTLVLLLGYVYGISVSATYNSYVAFGLSFVRQPSHKNVVYLQLMSGLGSTLAPFVSSMIVAFASDIVVAMQFCFVTLVLVSLSLLVCHFWHRQGGQAAAVA